MAIDPSLTSSPPGPGVDPVIDNEIPAYRAINPMAIFSTILGVGAVFCFTDLWFLIVAVAAAGTGLLAIRKINRYPDVLTGAGFAKVGIALGLAFGISALTREVVGGFMEDIDAGRFARRYVEVLKTDPIAMAFWYQQSPGYRAEKSPDAIFDEMKKQTGAAQQQQFSEKMGSIQAVKARLANQGETIKFSKIESKAADGLTQYSNALVEFDGPSKPAFGLIEMVKVRGESGSEWVVKSLRYPYKPASAAVELPHSDDDGHGH